MKMKLVCEQTGLTDRTVRFYIEEGLIHPDYTENYLGRKTFEFSESDVEELKHIATLRSFGFSIENVREILLRPESSHEIVREVRARTEEELVAGQKKVDALATLDGVEGATASRLAEMLETPVEQTPSVETVTRSPRRFAITILRTVGTLLVVWLPIVTALISFGSSFFEKTDPIWHPWAIVVTLLAMVPSLLAMLLRRHATARGLVIKRVLLGCCAFCIPFGFLCAGEIVSECPHFWGDFVTEVAATCSSEGRLCRRCEACGSEDFALIERLPHVEVIDKGKEASCEEAGLTDGAHCSVCWTLLKPQKLIERKPHTIVTSPVVIPTCGSTGLTEGKRCIDCGYEAVKQEIIPALQHDYNFFMVPATCGTKGYALYQCACGDSYQKNFVAATEMHNFVPNSNLVGYHCTGCNLEVCEYGNVDGSISGGNNRVKYYISGPTYSEIPVERRLVIYGMGAMPDFSRDELAPWFASFKTYDVTTVRITAGITRIGRFAFYAPTGNNPLINVNTFILENPDIEFSEIDVQAIKCRITYGG